VADDGDRPQVPPGVGPHELQELALMLAGSKPAAMFYDGLVARYIIPEDEFEPHVQAGRIIKHVVIEPDSNGMESICVYYALPGHEWRIYALEAINQPIRTGQRQATDQDDIETGHLLGYTEQEIASFMAWIKRDQAS